MLCQISLSKCQIACHCITCLLLQNLAEPGITLRNLKEICNSCKSILFWTFLLFYFDLIKNIIIEGQQSACVCLWVWSSWREGSFTAEWRVLPPKWLLMENWTQLGSRLGLSMSIKIEGTDETELMDSQLWICLKVYTIFKSGSPRVKPSTTEDALL